MSCPVMQPAEPHTELGTAGNDTFIESHGEVYRYDKVYWWPYCTARCWPQQSVAKRIARRHEEAEAARAKVRRERELVEAEHARNRKRQKRAV